MADGFGPKELQQNIDRVGFGRAQKVAYPGNLVVPYWEPGGPRRYFRQLTPSQTSEELGVRVPSSVPIFRRPHAPATARNSLAAGAMQAAINGRKEETQWHCRLVY